MEGQTLYSTNDWEAIKRSGTAAIERWIKDQMKGKSCIVVLVGSETSKRPWVAYEIAEAWNSNLGVLGVRIDKLLDANGRPSTPGDNPFASITFAGTSRSLDQFAQLKSPFGNDSKTVYASIANNIEWWIEEAIRIRQQH
jgi:hypothetical protein